MKKSTLLNEKYKTEYMVELEIIDTKNLIESKDLISDI